MEARQKSADAARAEYNAALKAYNDEAELAKAGTVDHRGHRQSVRRQGCSDSSRSWTRSAGLSAGVEVASEERIKRINDLYVENLKAGTALNTEDASEGRAGRVDAFRCSPDDMRAIAQARKGPRARAAAHPARHPNRPT